MDPSFLPEFLKAINYAAEKHKYQRRSGYDRLPYINHLLKVTEVLVSIGGETDQDLLIAALMHDIIEDGHVDAGELARLFGQRVADITVELSDDMSLSYAERKRRQVERATSLSEAARKIRVADKASNIRDLFQYPVNWREEKKLNYIENAVKVVDQIRGSNPKLDQWFDETVAWARKQNATMP